MNWCFTDVRSILMGKSQTAKQPLCDLLTYSMFHPTAEKMKERITSYQSSDIRIYACVENDAYLGVIVYRLCDRVATILDIAVYEYARSRGIGTFLIDGLLRESNASQVLAETDDDAIGFYQKYGFKVADTKTTHDCKRYLCRYKRGMTMTIREMLPSDADSILAIYKQGVESGKATFTTAAPSYEEWDAAHHTACRYVAVCDDVVVGFVALSPVSSKPHYSGVAEVMVYVDEHYHHRGIGAQLLNTLIKEAPQNGVWCLYASIFASNEPSIRLHSKCGFRTIGYRERIAKDRFGNWTDTVMMEYRFADDVVKE